MSHGHLPAVLRPRPWERSCRTEVLVAAPDADDLAEIVAAGASRAERTASRAFTAIRRPPAVRARLERWRSSFDGAGPRPSFERMCAVRGFDEAAIEASLSDVRLRDRSLLPRWAIAAVRLLRGLADTGAAAVDRTAFDALFDPLRQPLVELVVGGLRPPAGVRLDERVYGRLVVAVLDRWVRWVAATRDTVPPAPSVAEAWRIWLRQRPILARFLGETVVLTVDFVNTMLAQLAADRERLAGELGLGLKPTIELDDLRLGSGDSHNGGAGVAELSVGGHRLVYKPKNLEVALWFRRLHRALAERLPADLGLWFHRVVTAGDHAWEEHVAESPCGSRGEIRTFYRRAGVFLALAQAARGQDLHGENLLARGAFPVPVDLEVVAVPSPALVDSGLPWLRPAVTHLITSPLAGGLLPSLESLPGGGISYDGAFPSRHPLATRAGLCVPVLAAEDGRPRGAVVEDHVEELVEGFEIAARALERMGARGELRPLEEGLRRCPVRFLPRPTSLYGRILQQAWSGSPATTLDRELQLERVVAATPAAEPGLIRLADEEVWSMTHGDIPFFLTRPGERSLAAVGGPPIEVGFDPVASLTLAPAAGSGSRVRRDAELIRAAVGVLRLPA